MKILVTGGAGFIGSHFVDLCVERGHDVSVVDALLTGGFVDNVHPDARLVVADVLEITSITTSSPDVVVHFAAETHVDRAIVAPRPFLRSNVLGTQAVIDYCLREDAMLVYVSTDEVYGPAPEGVAFCETSARRPRNAYAASKTAGEMLVDAAVNTHGLRAAITRGVNTVGPRQFHEKLVPLVVRNALRDETIPVYGNGRQRRQWIFVRDHVDAVYFVMSDAHGGGVFNVGTGVEAENLEIVRAVLRVLEKPESLIAFVSDRPGHDPRYAVSTAKLEAAGWSPRAKTMDDIIAASVTNGLLVESRRD